MTFPPVSLADWRAKVEAELKGAAFDKALTHVNAEGIRVQPLYVEAPKLAVPHASDAVRLCSAWDGRDQATLTDEIAGGADALWLRSGVRLDAFFAREDARRCFLVLDLASAESLPRDLAFALTADPIGDLARGRDAELAAFAERVGRHARVNGRSVMVSTLPYHDAGADAADELAFALSTGAAYLRSLVAAGMSVAEAAAQLSVQTSVGRDTFDELCKLRALRVCWHKLCAVAGAPGTTLLVHAVSSSRALTVRDPWVNMLRISTQVFAASLGGADLVTPAAFDEAAGAASYLGRRVARNTLLVLREESWLGRVLDPAAGSYYLDSLTDALAREAWQRFRAIEADGGIVAMLGNGKLRARLDAAWQRRSELVTKRKEAIVGVSEFANLDESVPKPSAARAHDDRALPQHRDAEAIEALRDRADALARACVSVVTLGPPAEHRARVGFATALFAVAGLGTQTEPNGVACLCGSDERYAVEAADAARALKAQGCARVLLAGRPGALEPALRAAGVDDFIFLGCDVVAALAPVVAALEERAR
jgi:methylmalonyl-CoA mutase